MLVFLASKVEEEEFTWAVGHCIAKAACCDRDVFACCYDLDGSTESIDQAVADPCWITSAGFDCQSFRDATDGDPWRN